MRKNNSILRFDNLSKFDHVIHGFSTRFFGSMRPRHPESLDSLKQFTQALGIAPEKVVRMGQVHSNTVNWVTEKDREQIIPETDGLLSDTPDIFLGVVTGDCVPLLFYDPQKKIVAAIHAGWRGLFSEIIKETVVKMIAKGTDPKNLIVGIGPCIGVCHYDIPKERADMFVEKFLDWKSFIISREDRLFLDLAGVAYHQLRSAGVLDANIEQADYCTFDHKDIYSYRREGEDFGEMMGVIGIK